MKKSLILLLALSLTFVTSCKKDVKESEKEINFQLEAYPNPTKNRLTLRVNLFEYQQLEYTLYDLKGKILEKNKILKPNTYIDFNELPVSTYFLKVSNENRLSKTFTILKN